MDLQINNSPATAAAESAAVEETPKPKTPKASKRKGKMPYISRYVSLF